MKHLIVAPSVLSLDYTDTKSQLQLLNDSKAQWMHFDVMDGHFVPNLTFGPDILKAFKRSSSLFMDVHIMVDDPEKIAPIFMDAGANSIVFHVEALPDHDAQRKLIADIQSRGVKAGISLKPDTPVEEIKHLLPYLDLVLVMSVYPGFGGQSFISERLDTIRQLRTWIDENHYNTLIEVDGGINASTAALCKEAGVDVVVAGSYVFGGDIIENVASLWEIE